MFFFPCLSFPSPSFLPSPIPGTYSLAPSLFFVVVICFIFIWILVNIQCNVCYRACHNKSAPLLVPITHLAPPPPTAPPATHSVFSRVKSPMFCIMMLLVPCLLGLSLKELGKYRYRDGRVLEINFPLLILPPGSLISGQKGRSSLIVRGKTPPKRLVRETAVDIN